MPESWKKSNKALIPKEGGNVTLTRNYRSILLLNNDSKLFVTILADRLKIILPGFIHEDQRACLPQGTTLEMCSII